MYRYSSVKLLRQLVFPDDYHGNPLAPELFSIFIFFSSRVYVNHEKKSQAQNIIR